MLASLNNILKEIINSYTSTTAFYKQFATFCLPEYNFMHFSFFPVVEETTIHRQPLDKTRRHICVGTNILEFVTSKTEETHKDKQKIHPRTGQEGPEREQKYTSTLTLTSALDGVGGQRHTPAALSPGKTRYPLYRRLGGPHGRSGGCGIFRHHWDLIPGSSSP
jgi:hypothetical protein